MIPLRKRTAAAEETKFLEVEIGATCTTIRRVKNSLVQGKFLGVNRSRVQVPQKNIHYGFKSPKRKLVEIRGSSPPNEQFVKPGKPC
jgi:hypothetical protein